MLGRADLASGGSRVSSLRESAARTDREGSRAALGEDRIVLQRVEGRAWVGPQDAEDRMNNVIDFFLTGGRFQSSFAV